jgi:hypothetical protein
MVWQASEPWRRVLDRREPRVTQRVQPPRRGWPRATLYGSALYRIAWGWWGVVGCRRRRASQPRRLRPLGDGHCERAVGTTKLAQTCGCPLVGLAGGFNQKPSNGSAGTPAVLRRAGAQAPFQPRHSSATWAHMSPQLARSRVSLGNSPPLCPQTPALRSSRKTQTLGLIPWNGSCAPGYSAQPPRLTTPPGHAAGPTALWHLHPALTHADLVRSSMLELGAV